MIWADVTYQQHLNPLPDWVFGSALWSTLLAGVPVVVLFYLLVPRRWLAPKAAGAAAVVAFLIAVLVYWMSPLQAGMAFLDGAGFGLLPVGWTIFNAMLLYNITVQTGQFDVVRRSVAGLSGDARIQAVLIGFAFGAFLEGAAGGGTPVAICGAIMVGLGFDPFLAAVLCLIANTSPVAYGGLGTPLITLTGVTDLNTQTLSIMAGHQLPLMSFFIPLYMVKCMCSWRQTFEIWPVLLVAGGSFAVFQFVFATMTLFGVALYPMTDIGGGIFSLVLTAIFLRFWKPRKEWHFNRTPAEVKAAEVKAAEAKAAFEGNAKDPHAAEATALLAPSSSPTGEAASERPLNAGRIMLAWAPFAIMSLLLLLSGLLRQEEGNRKREKQPSLMVGPIQTVYTVPVPFLDQQVMRDGSLHDPNRGEQKPEKAEFEIPWITTPGSPVFVAALLSMLLLRMKPPAIFAVFKRTCIQMKIPIPTIALMLGLSYITRYAGMDATLGVAFAYTGAAYPFFGTLLGWLGVFLTGTDAGSNALFGSLQKITATKIYQAGWLTQLDLGQAQVLICTANSTGGVMGKMIDAQSIVVATAATNQLGREADIFKAVIWHSFILASVVGAITLLQAYVWPFTLLVPHLP
jgi:lactate permease